MNKALILFSGTRSFERVFTQQMNWNSRGVDIDNHFRPYYHVDILTWDYKNELKQWTPDYIHASPVCKYFTNMKNDTNRKEGEYELGIKLVEKTLEIINYVLSINPDLLFTIENPVGKMRKLDIMKPYKRVTTSYCKYGFPYRKATDIWCNFDLYLRSCCTTKHLCNGACDNEGRHKVVLGYKPKHDNQIIGWKYFTILRHRYNIVGYTDTYFRYRMPPKLIKNILLSVQLNI